MMVEIQTNPMTGEVRFDLAGQNYALHATMPRLAAFQAATGLTGAGALVRSVALSDARSLYEGAKCLCSSGNAEVLETTLLMPCHELLQQAITAALVAGFPEVEETAPGKSKEAKKVMKSPGADTVS